MTNAQLKYPHDADPDIFREALAYSEADKGLTSILIEKDPCSNYKKRAGDPRLFRRVSCYPQEKAKYPGL